MHVAAASGQIGKIVELVRRGFDTNGYDSNGWTPLMRASGSTDKTTESARVQVIKVLIEHGADANAKSLPIKVGGLSIDDPRTTALAVAAENGSAPLAAALIASGAKVNERFANDRSALMVAAGVSSHISDRDVLEVVRVLVKAGADVNAEASNRVSALFEAARTDRLGVAALLMESGVNRNSLSAQLALSRAKGTDIYNMMVAAGVSESAFHLIAASNISPLVAVLQKPGPDVVYEGQDGRSAGNAIKIHGAKSDQEGTAAIIAYVNLNEHGYILKYQALLVKDDQKIDAITYLDGQGDEQILYFDVTEAFAKR
jgi:ankyrin repeat protein